MFIYIPFKIPYLWCQIYNTGVYGQQQVMPYFKSTYWGMLRTTTVRVRENNHRQIYLCMYVRTAASQKTNKLRTIPHTVRFIHSILQTEWSPFIWTMIDGWAERDEIVLLVCMRMLEGIIPQWIVILCWGVYFIPTQ